MQTAEILRKTRLQGHVELPSEVVQAVIERYACDHPLHPGIGKGRTVSYRNIRAVSHLFPSNGTRQTSVAAAHRATSGMLAKYLTEIARISQGQGRDANLSSNVLLWISTSQLPRYDLTQCFKFALLH